MSLRIGSLFTGTGALDLAVMDVFDADVVWHSQYEPPDKNGKEDVHQYAARILARHWPTVPNLGDITKVDWQAVIEEHGPIDILTGGFPCQDVSSAGKRAGLTADSRSGLWTHFARAIHELNPRLVVIENVQGLLSAPADRGLEPDAQAVDEDPGEGAGGKLLPGGGLRALGAVLGDLATLGFHAEWARVAASEVGAPHPRKRVFIYAWPAAVDPGRLGRWDGPRILSGLGAAGRDTEAAADAANLGHERGRNARDGRSGSADGNLAAADTCRTGLEVGGVEPARNELPAAERGRRQPAANADGIEPERRGVAGVLGGQATAEQGKGDQRERAGDAAGDSGEAATDAGRGGLQGHGELPAGRDGVQQRVRHDADRRQPAVPDPAGVGRHEGRPESAGQQGRSDAAECSGAAPADADHGGRREDVLQLRPGQPDLDWGDYGPAIRRWEAILGRPAPWPTDGWVTNTPGLTRPAMLRALGNGVVWQQAAAAIRLLHQRAAEDTTRTAA